MTQPQILIAEVEQVWPSSEISQHVRRFVEEKIEAENKEIIPKLKKAKYKVTYEKITIKPKSLHHEEELRQLLSLQNENILRFLGVSDVYFVFQKCEVSLDYVLLEQSVKFTTRDACLILLNIALALTYLHSQGYIHRDICRQNIVFTEKNEGRYLEVKLASLDSVCDASNPKMKFPPANFTFEPLTPKFDVWSLGIVTLESFTRWTHHRYSNIHPTPYRQPKLLHFQLHTLLNPNRHKRLSAKEVVQKAAEGLTEEHVEIDISKPASAQEVLAYATRASPRKLRWYKSRSNPQRHTKRNSFKVKSPNDSPTISHLSRSQNQVQ